MKKLVEYLEYEITLIDDQPVLTAKKTNKFFIFDFPVKEDGSIDITAIPVKGISGIYNADGTTLPFSLCAPLFAIPLDWYF